MANLTILTMEPKQITAGKILVSFSRKSTKQNPVEEKDKFRAVERQPYVLPLIQPQGEIEGKTYDYSAEACNIFRDAVAEAFMAAASQILKDYCDANKTATEISEDALSVAAVVAKMADMQTSQRLNGEQITAWYDASKTKTDATGRYGDSEKGKRQQVALREKYISLASNNPGIDAGLAVKMLGYINADDTSSPVAAAVIKRLERLSKVDTADEL